MTPIAVRLARWACDLEPAAADVALASRSLRDTVAVALAAREHPVTRLAAGLPDGARWAVAGHVLDYDDLHMPSTTHISAVCVPAALAMGGGARAYLAAAGVMARLGTALGWPHYSAGWHATCTAGAPGRRRRGGGGARAAGRAGRHGHGAGRARGGRGAAGVRHGRQVACRWASPWRPGSGPPGWPRRARGPTRPRWMTGSPWSAVTRPRQARTRWTRAPRRCPAGWRSRSTRAATRCSARSARWPSWPASGLDPAQVRRIVLSTPEATVVPLIHHRPETGLQGKFSLEYAAAAALLDGHPGFASFTDAAVRRPAARRLAGLVETELTPGGSWLLDGELHAEVHLAGGAVRRVSQRFPPGSPGCPPTGGQLDAKLADCLAGAGARAGQWTWDNAADVLRKEIR